MSKPLMNENGEVLFTLQGVEYTLRKPKVKDLEAIELGARKNVSNTRLLCLTANALMTPKIPVNGLLELDVEDFEVLAEAVKTLNLFRDKG